MALPRLDEAVARMDAVQRKTLFEPIRYTVTGDGATFFGVDAYVDYQDALRGIETGQVIEQDIKVQIFVADLPEKPNGTHRLNLPKLPEKLWKPVNVGRDESGDLWDFDLKEVDG